MHTITNLTGGAEYTLRVIATNAVGDSSPSHEVTRTLNRFATGDPTITGTARVGETLTGEHSAIADEDGLTNASFRYSWFVDPSPNEVTRQLHRRSTYVLRPDDVHRTTQFYVGFTDDAGFHESRISVPTATVVPTVPDPPRKLAATSETGALLLQ